MMFKTFQTFCWVFFLLPIPTLFGQKISEMTLHHNVWQEKTAPNFEKMSDLVKAQILQGDVIFHEDLDAYCQAFVGIFQPKIALAAPCKFYVWKSDTEEILITSKTEVLLPLGLLAKIESETEMAFVVAKALNQLSTEAQTTFFAGQDIWGRTQSTLGKGRIQYLDSELLSDNASIELLGAHHFELYELAPFFDKFILAPTYAPFRKFFFEAGQFRLPATYFLKRTASEDVPQTAELFEQRKQNALTLISAQANTPPATSTQISPEMLKNLVAAARIALTDRLLEKGKYETALFSAYQQAATTSPTFTLQKQVAKALYGYTKHRNHHKDSLQRHLTLHEQQAGELQQAYYFLGQLRENELNVLAANYIWRMYKKNTNDLEMSLLAKDIFQELVDFHYEKASDFSAKLLSESDSMELKLNWVKYAFAEYMADSAFNNQFKRAKINKDAGKKEAQKVEKLTKKGKTAQMEQEIKGARLGISNLVIVNPTYQIYEQKKVAVLNEMSSIEVYAKEKSEVQTQRLREALQKNLQLSGLNHKLLIIDNLSSKNLTQLNEYISLNTWAMRHGTKADSSSQVDVHAQALFDLAKKYNTDYFLFTGITATQTPKKTMITVFQHLKGILVPAFLPATLRYDMRKAETSRFYAVLYQVKTGKAIIIKDFRTTQPIDKAILNAQLYDVLMQIKTKK